MQTQMYCPSDSRRALVRADNRFNGIDYLEVLDDRLGAEAAISLRQTFLLVHCLRSLPAWTADNVRVEGGVRVTGLRVLWAVSAEALLAAAPPLSPEVGQPSDSDRALLTPLLTAIAPPERDRVLVVRVSQAGDFSPYTLTLLPPEASAAQFDPLLRSVQFFFKVDCPSEFDCKAKKVCADEVVPPPTINYLAKDYASFRRLMLDRLAVLVPNWSERNPADLGIALVEVLAYGADYLSYYQDAIATEAYLGTARRRASVRRHARLVDYTLHDGANARTWIALEIDSDEVRGSRDLPVLPAKTQCLSRGRPAAPALPANEVAQSFAAPPVVFETMEPVLLLKRARNRIEFYTGGDDRCCLPRGATEALLMGSAAKLELQRGDVLILEETISPTTNQAADADPMHRHAVRLSRPPVEYLDPLTGTPFLAVTWHEEDALPFPLCLTQAGVEGTMAIARGNVVLADHGKTEREPALLPAQVPEGDRYRPRLSREGLTHARPYHPLQDRDRPAQALMDDSLEGVLPQIQLEADQITWLPQATLLRSDRFAPEFVVEMEEDGWASLRFGDGILGRKPVPNTVFEATYRLGNGRSGNIGADSLYHVVTDSSDLQGAIARITNPLPAWGGLDPEPLSQAQIYAPQAFQRQERAVTVEDYATIAQRHPEVQRAAATRRWTGSWYTTFVTVDRRGGRPITPDFESELRQFFDRYRMAGGDVDIDAPIYVPLDLALQIVVEPGYIASNIKRSLLEVFSDGVLPDGRQGFFHPDRLTFGQPIYLSQIIAAAMAQPGVARVQPVCFQRWGQLANQELETGVMHFERLEIPRLDNDPNAPENGHLKLLTTGGL